MHRLSAAVQSRNIYKYTYTQTGRANCRAVHDNKIVIYYSLEMGNVLQLANVIGYGTYGGFSMYMCVCIDYLINQNTTYLNTKYYKQIPRGLLDL